MKYRKKLVVVDAFQLNPRNRKSVKEWIGEKAWFYESNGDSELYIQTLEGVMVANEGDWIIKGIRGEFYPCKPYIFEASYEKVEDQDENV